MTDYKKWDNFDDEEAIAKVDKEPSVEISSQQKDIKKVAVSQYDTDKYNRKHLKNVAAALKSKVLKILIKLHECSLLYNILQYRQLLKI